MNPLGQLRPIPTHLDALVWHATLTPDIESAPFLEVLSEDEHARLNRYGDKQMARRFLFRRGLLRYLLAGQTGREPKQIQLREGPHGKPTTDLLSFSVSSSEDETLFAISFTGQVGVDVETIREFAYESLVKQFFTEREQMRIDAKGKDEFFRLWARKEAVVKAQGVGIGIDLKQLDVVEGPLEDLSVNPSVCAAVAMSENG